MTIPTSKIRRSSKIRFRAAKAANQLSRNRLRTYVGSRHPTIVRRTINIPDWPEKLDRFTIAHLSDFHLGELLTLEDAARFLDEFRSALTEKPDLVVVTGDILDFSPHGSRPLLRQLAQFPSRLGTFAVLGNHDILVNRDQFIADCKTSALRLLINESISLFDRGVPVHLLGIAWSQKRRHLEQNIAETYESLQVNGQLKTADGTAATGATIVLAHNPRAFAPAVKYQAHLVLSGHTHGGQLNFLRPTAQRPAVGLGSIAHRYSWGIYEKGNSRLHVTSGIGSWFPFRVKCPSEIALLTIRHSAEPNPNRQHHAATLGSS